MATFQNGHLRINASLYFNTYDTSAKELHQFIFPLDHSHALFIEWLLHHIHHYEFEETIDFILEQTLEDMEKEGGMSEGYPENTPLEERINQVGDIRISLNMAKELARIARTAQAREARYYLLDFEYQMIEQELGVSFDKKIKQLNKLAHSMKIGKNVVILPTVELINLVQTIRQYQHIAHLYVTPEHDSSPTWVNGLISKIKKSTGKLLFSADEQG